jgi:hypothetical protein
MNLVSPGSDAAYMGCMQVRPHGNDVALKMREGKAGREGSKGTRERNVKRRKMKENIQLSL